MDKNWIMHVPWEVDSVIRMGGAAGRKETYYQTVIKNTLCVARALVQNVRIKTDSNMITVDRSMQVFRTFFLSIGVPRY